MGTVQQLASIIIDAMMSRSIDPPFVFIGYSFGAIVMSEVLRQWTHSEQILCIISIDAGFRVSNVSSDSFGGSVASFSEAMRQAIGIIECLQHENLLTIETSSRLRSLLAKLDIDHVVDESTEGNVNWEPSTSDNDMESCFAEHLLRNLMMSEEFSANVSGPSATLDVPCLMLHASQGTGENEPSHMELVEKVYTSLLSTDLKVTEVHANHFSILKHHFAIQCIEECITSHTSSIPDKYHTVGSHGTVCFGSTMNS